MNDVVSIARRDFTASQIDLIRRTVARDCSATEFDHFCAVSQRLQLDPLRKQICALVFSKDDEAKRNMVIIVQIDGLRAIAQRCGDYRPMESPPLIEYDPDLKSPANPLGIVRAEVRLWKLAAGEWHPVVGESFWDEFAPIKEIAEGGYDWVDTGEVWADSGKPKKRKVARGDVVMGIEPTSPWHRQGRVMIAKCAESQALRRGWPEQFSGVYSEEEMQRAQIIDAAASEVIAEYAEQKRIARVNPKEAALFVFEDGGALERVERGQVADRLAAFYAAASDAQTIITFRDRNAESLKTFWAWSPGDALELKKAAEKRIAELIEAKKDKSAEPAPQAEGAGASVKTGDAGLASGGAETPPAPSPLSKKEIDALQREIVGMIGDAETLAQLEAIPDQVKERLERAPAEVRARAAERIAAARGRFKVIV